MQTRTIKNLAISALALGLLAAIQTASAAPEGIKNTRHNLGSNGQNVAAGGTRTGSSGMGDVFTLGTTEICVFCHTPHGANTDVPVPLWNKGSLPSTNYTVYSSGTMNTAAPASMAGHMSLACLSCHDGTQAMDNMVNQPGQGGYTAGGARLGTDVKTAVFGGTEWYAGTNDTSAADYNAGDTLDGKLISSAGIDFIGTDLSNDHPIGMPFAGGGCTAAGSTAGCSDADFNAASAGLNGYFQVGGSDPAGAKTAMRLYGTSLASATVECASCHDPHSDAQGTFLRRSNSASGVCLTCHNK